MYRVSNALNRQILKKKINQYRLLCKMNKENACDYYNDYYKYFFLYYIKKKCQAL